MGQVVPTPGHRRSLRRNSAQHQRQHTHNRPVGARSVAPRERSRSSNCTGAPSRPALVDEAILAEDITDDERRIAAGMALYAIEIQSGLRPGPYADTDAEQYARAAIALRRCPLPRQRPGAHPRAATQP